MCIAPIVIMRDKGNYDRFASDRLPCGRCPECRKRRVAMWQFRLEQEAKVAETSAFLTLTYDNDNLNFTSCGLPTLSKRDHQLFIKRLRKRIEYYIPRKSERPKIRYYAVGEYGTRTSRPHMHSIMFDVPKFFLDNPEIISLEWQKGHVRVDPCNEATIGYVCGYVMKSVIDGKDKEEEPRQREFSLMSKGMGLSYLTPNVIEYLKRKENPYLVVPDGKKVLVPRYYKDKVFDDGAKKRIAKKALKHLEEQDKFENPEHELAYKFDLYRREEKKRLLKRATL